MSEIAREVSGSKGRHLTHIDGAEAELTCSILSPTHIIADHTGVPDALRGTGVGLRPVERLVADARAGGVEITALCPFVRAQAQRHPEWADLFA